MKRVLMVTGSLDYGGLEIVALEIAKQVDKKQYIFDFLVFGEKSFMLEDEVYKLGGKIIRIEKNSLYSYVMQLRRVFKENGPYDVVHTHLYYNSGIVVLIAKLCNVPYCISHSHSIKRSSDYKPVKAIYNFIMRILIKMNSDLICACSQEAGYNLVGKKYFQDKGNVLYNPIDIKKFSFSEQARRDIRKKLSINDNDIVIGQVGRLSKVKNQIFLIDIFHEFLKKKKAVLIIVGDGPEKDSLIKHATDLGLASKVIFLGGRDDISRILSSFDVFVMTSIHEGFGIVLIEAIANGLNCICESKSVVSEIRELPNLMLVDGFNENSWVNSIDVISSTDSDSRLIKHKDIYKYDIVSFKQKVNEFYKFD